MHQARCACYAETLCRRAASESYYPLPAFASFDAFPPPGRVLPAPLGRLFPLSLIHISEPTRRS
eukprot:5883124-Prymnesium_polylepis.1